MITYYSATPQAWKDETDDFEVGNMQTFRIFLHSEMQFTRSGSGGAWGAEGNLLI